MARPSIALFLATAGLIAGVTGCGHSSNAPAPKGGETLAPSTAAPAPAPAKPEAEKGEKGEEGGEGGEN
ncbi:MAG: hypothetical protein WAM11_17015 [Cyanobium sp.]